MQSRGRGERNRIEQCLAEWFKLDQLSNRTKVRKGIKQRKRKGWEWVCARREEISSTSGVAQGSRKGRGWDVGNSCTQVLALLFNICETWGKLLDFWKLLPVKQY